MENCFTNLNDGKAFSLNSGSVKIIFSPKDFFQELKQAILLSHSKISLCSLYLGSSNDSEELLCCIHEACKKGVEVSFLLDFSRNQRKNENSLRLLQPLLNFPNLQVYLYRIPHNLN